ncbi:LOW QUALITY PROTEIN: peptide methionine sulfoxide reductase MsrA-like [Morphnus guianensis]
MSPPVPPTVTPLLEPGSASPASCTLLPPSVPSALPSTHSSLLPVRRGSRPRRDVPSLGGPWWVLGGPPSPTEALLGRAQRPPVAATHAVNGNPTIPSFPAETQMAIFGMGCFWGAEQLFWELPGVFSTQVGYAGGFTPNPIYEEVCTGLMGHVEVVRVIFNPWKLSYKELLKVFWENHDPTQGMQQQEDLSTQYGSITYTLGPQQQAAALCSREVYQQVDGDTGTPPGDTGTPPGDTGHHRCHLPHHTLGGGPLRVPWLVPMSPALQAGWAQQAAPHVTAPTPPLPCAPHPVLSSPMGASGWHAGSSG